MGEKLTVSFSGKRNIRDFVLEDADYKHVLKLRNGFAIRQKLAMTRNREFDLRMTKERSEDPLGDAGAPLGPLQTGRARLTNARFFVLGGFLMVPVCVMGLFWQQPYIWEICPQALVVMFLRQSQRAYDSLGAAGYPDLAVAVLYYPVVGGILSRAAAREKLPSTAARVVVWHVVAIGLAFGTAAIRNQLWGF